MICIDRLKELLSYDPETGIWRWAVARKKAPLGGIAGTKKNTGYIVIKVDHKDYLAHRLAWFYMTGEWPSEIDHKDTNRSNNKFSNLRVSTHQMNLGNKNIHINNKTGFKGVFKIGKRYRAKIGFSGKTIYLGTFDTAEEAAIVYDKAAKQYFGEFSRSNGVQHN